MAYRVNSYKSYTNEFNYRNPYSMSLGSVSSDTSNSLSEGMRKWSQFPDVPAGRSGMKKAFDVLLAPNYAIAGAADALVAGRNPGVAFAEGLSSGLNFMSDAPMYEQKTFSNVLETAGWKPTSTLGRFAKGATGFALDVILDPTTYLSGGISAVVKGTGKAGLATAAKGFAESVGGKYGIKVGDDLKQLPNQVYESVLSKNKGVVSDELAERFARSQADDVERSLAPYLGGMTPDLAKTIIEAHSKKKNMPIAAEQLAVDAEKMTRRFNKAIGFNASPTDLTWSLNNMPLVNRLFPKALREKSVTLGTAEGIAKFSDEMEISTAYNAIRKSIYGTRIGKLFSTKTGMYQLATKSPDEFYDMVKYADYTQGLNIDKAARETLIVEKVKQFKNLTPAEHKNIITALQDKRAMQRVHEAVKFADTEEGKAQRVKVERERVVAKQEVSRIMEEYEQIKMLDDAQVGEVANVKEAVKVMRQEHLEKLINLRTTHSLDMADKQKVLESLYREAEALRTTDELGSAGDDVEKVKQVELERKYLDEQLVKEIDMYRANWEGQGNEARKKVFQERAELKKKKISGKVIKDMSEDDALEAERWNQAIDEQMTQMVDDAQGFAADRIATIEKLGEYLWDDPKFISTTTTDNNIQTLLRMVNMGESKDEILFHIEKNGDMYSGKGKQMYSFIASKLGYGQGKEFKDWKSFYSDRKLEIVSMAEKAGGMNDNLYNQMLYLEEHNARRQALISMFKNMSVPEMMRYISDDADEMLLKELQDKRVIADEVEEVRRKAYDDQSAMNTDASRLITKEDSTGRMIDEKKYSGDKDFNYKELQDKQAYNYKLTSSVRLDVQNDMINMIGAKSVKKLGVFKVVADEVEWLLNKQFKREYHTLTEPQKRYVLFMAMKNKKLIGKGESRQRNFTPEDAKRIRDSQQQVELDKVASIQRQIKQDSNVRFVEKPEKEVMTHTGGKKIRPSLEDEGKVVAAVKSGDGAITYTVIKKNGDRVEGISAHRILSVNNDGVVKTVDDIMQDSIMGVAHLEEKAIHAEKLAKLTGEMGNARAGYKQQRDKFLEDYRSRATSAQDRLIQAEKLKDDYAAKLLNVDFDKADELRKSMDEFDDAMSSDEAFETYMRMREGDEFVDGAMDRGMRVTTAVLSDLNLSAKEEEIFKVLRASFMEMGEEEVKRGKLGRKQFDSMMNRYIPHILTDDGSRLIEKYSLKWDEATQKVVKVERDIQKDGEYLTQDLGYGVKWNPYAEARSIKTVKLANGEVVHNPTIAQINDGVKHLLEGKNLFSENVADIYLARAMKNSELMYDHDYMQKMMHVFGKSYDGTLDEGYKIVMNYGKMKELTKSVASMRLSMHISTDLSQYVTGLYREARGQGITLSRDVVDAAVKSYMAKTYSKESISKLHKGFSDEYYSRIGMSADDFEATRTPMLELGAEQADTINNYHKSTVQGLLNRIEEVKKGVTDEYNASHGTLGEEAFGKELREMDRVEKWLGTLVAPQIKQVNDVIVQKANQARKVQMAKDANKFLQVYDKFTHLIKLNMTTIMPAFHARNKMSNVFLNWLGVGGDALSPRMQIDTWKTVYHRGDAGKLKGLRIDYKDSQGATVSREMYDLYQQAKGLGVVDEGFFAKDIGAGAQSSGLFGGGKMDPTDTKDFAPYKLGATVGSQIENSDRFLHFVSKLKQGSTPEEAAESVNKFLFDYSDLTAFEQNVMKRLIPFYTFMRKNGELQMRELLNQPEKFRLIAKMMNGVEGMTNEEDRLNKGLVNQFAKDWIQTPWSVTNQMGNKEPIMINPNMPFQEFSRIPNPMHPIQSALNLFTQSNPIFKAPIEQAMNKNVYFDQPIADSKGSVGQQIGQRADHIAAQTAWYNAGKDLVMKRGLDWGLELINNTIGIKALSYDYEYFKWEALKDYNEKKDGGFVGDVKRSIVEGFNEQVSYAKDLVADKINASRPTDAGLYNGAMAPISKSSYDKLSSEQKRQYTPPTEEQSIAYSVAAKAMEEKETREAGVAKKFIWFMADASGLSKEKPEMYVGSVTRVIDGDTFKVMIGDKEQDVRMLLVDTPETVHPDKPEQPFGKAASDRTNKALISKDVRIILDPKSDKYDKYNRMLGYIEVDGQDFNKQLISEGLGKYRYDFNDYGKGAEYREAEVQASESQRGFWQLPGYAQAGVDADFSKDNAVLEAYKRMMERGR